MYQDLKEEIRRRYQNSKLMQNYRDNQTKLNHPFQSIGQGIGNAYKKFNGIDKANSLMNAQSIQPSTLGSVNAASNASNAVQGANTASTASTAANGLSNISNAGSKAAPVLGLASAGGNFAKGDNVNGALDLAKTGAMFIPGVGWAVAGAIQIGQMVKNAMDKKRQQAMAKGQEENAKAQQQAMQDYANQKQGIDELQMENAQNMQAQLDKQNQDTMAQESMQPQDQGVYNQPDYSQGQVTGGAAPVPMPTNYAEESMPKMTPEEMALIEQQQNPQQVQQEEIKRSLMDKFRSGLSDFSAGYQDNANTDFAHGDLANGIMTGGASPVQASPNTFNLGAQANKKSIMARLGELAGTGQRVMAHPLTQAAIAGGISRMAGGDIDDVAKAAFQYGSQKAAADRYYQQVTGNTNRPFLNSYNAQDVTNKRLEDAMAQKQQQWMYEQMIKQAQQNWNNRFNQEKFDYQKEQDKQKLDLQREIHDARLQGKGGYGRYQGRPQPFDPTTVHGFYDDYQSYEEDQNIINDPELYNKEWDDMLHAMYGDRWFYSDKQRQDAKNELDKRMNKNKNDFYRKYRINPMKGKKA